MKTFGDLKIDDVYYEFSVSNLKITKYTVRVIRNAEDNKISVDCGNGNYNHVFGKKEITHRSDSGSYYYFLDDFGKKQVTKKAVLENIQKKQEEIKRLHSQIREIRDEYFDVLGNDFQLTFVKLF